MATSSDKNEQRSWNDRLVSAVLIAIVRLVGMLPYHQRVPVGGWVVGNILAPLIGYRKRVRENLNLVRPDLSETETSRLVKAVPTQIGRTVTELFSPDAFAKIAAEAPITGAGFDEMEAARAAGRPIILVSGHIGNYDAVRSALIQRGYPIGGLYRAMNYAGFNDYYVSKISQIGTPLFLRGRRGMAQMVKYLREGNVLALLIDQHMGAGEPLTFFGHTAYTALSAAEMALKYDALLVPVYGIRQPDGLSYEVVVNPPIAHSDAVTMTQALNDDLEAQVRAHMDQWLWIHRRWKELPDQD
jgi:KDO2-lipid IV(A) lauroyltransferase